MPTIHSMLSGTYSMYKTAQNNGSLFQSAKSGGDMFRTVNSAAQSASDTLSGLQGVQTGRKELLSSYASAKDSFYEDFDDAMGALKSSAAAIRKMDFKVGENAVTTTENEDGTTTTKKSDELVAALKAVEKLASDYNDAIDFFADNSGVSKRVDRMQAMFSDTTYRAGSLESIGIQVNAKTGKLSIDEDRLTKAITESPEKVSSVLGKNGLADKADSHVSIANSQRDRLFPSATSMIGADLKSSSVYTGTSLLNISKYATTGSFLNMMG